MGESEQIRVGIVGASGYGGVQLVRLLSEHPQVEITYLGGSSSAGRPYTDLYPHLAVPLTVEKVAVETIVDRCDVVFLSLPNGLAYTLTPQLLERGCKVLDLSADYRFAIWTPTKPGTAAIAPMRVPISKQCTACPNCSMTSSPERA